MKYFANKCITSYTIIRPQILAYGNIKFTKQHAIHQTDHVYQCITRIVQQNV